MSKPRIPITDARFKYRNAANTDISRTFRRHRLLMRLQEQREAQDTHVVQLTTARKAQR